MGGSGEIFDELRRQRSRAASTVSRVLSKVSCPGLTCIKIAKKCVQ